MPIEHVFRVQQLLEHINTDRWGTGGRNAAVLLVVANQSHWPCPARLTAADFEELGRSRKAARYDREVVVPRLVADRVLTQVGTGRRAHFGINADLAHWHRVPGLPSWRSVVSLFSGPLFAKAARPMPKTAGQSAPPMPVQALFEQVWAEALSVIQGAPGARGRAIGARPPGQTPPETGLQRAPGAPPVHAFEVFSSNESKTSSPLEEGRGGRCAPTDQGRRLIAALSKATGKPIVGRFATELDAIAARAGTRLEAVVARAGATRLFMIEAAIADLAAFVDAGGGAPVCRRCGGSGVWHIDGYGDAVCNHLELS